ncbi:DNA-binding protein [Streptomyces scopuliridis RB72]|uniref:DNA-binding protein n=1 Tax=Streptomyces scopuliridis RB72 TaxID=1440053 RepID=A0A2T7T555_9ACTN|nr:DNA-binding protein [Streptomyces scopuliridis RB72]
MTQRRVSTGNRVSTVLARQLGGQLLAFREAAGLNQSRAAEVLSAQTAKVAKMERGWVPFRDPDIIALCKLYGVEDAEVVDGLLRLAKLDRDRRKAKGWWSALDQGNLREYIAMEDVALKVRLWQLSVIPGLFQTPEYTRALAVPEISPDEIDHIERVVDVRRRRQARLYGDHPLQVHAVIWEAALRQMIGGPRAMGQQLAHLRELTELPNVHIQLLPFRAGGYPGVGGPFNILSFADEGAVDVIHMDGLGSTVWVEGEQESAAYAQLFGRLCAASLSPYDSVQLIEGIGKEMSE